MTAPCPALVFDLTIAPRPSASGPTVQAILADLAAFADGAGIALEPRARAMSFLASREGSQTTEQDRDAMCTWASRWAADAAIDVGALVDRREPPTTPAS